MQQDRRHNPTPPTWELPLIAVTTVVVLLVLAVHAGAAAANLLTGHGAHWPATQVLLTSLPGILAGDSTAALTTTTTTVTSPAPRHAAVGVHHGL